MYRLTKAEWYEMECQRGVTIPFVQVGDSTWADQIEATSNITVQIDYTYPIKSGQQRRRERRKTERRIKKTK